MRRGEIYRVKKRLPERGGKGGFYVVVATDSAAQNPDIEYVICAPVYGVHLGLATELVVGPDEGIPQTSAIRCDFLTVIPKAQLGRLVGILGPEKRRALDGALAYALDLRLGDEAAAP